MAEKDKIECPYCGFKEDEFIDTSGNCEIELVDEDKLCQSCGKLFELNRVLVVKYVINKKEF